jgi:hypothetical protein
MTGFKKNIEQHPITAIVTAVAATVTLMCIAFGFFLNAIIATKDATIELQGKKIKDKDETIAAYEKKSERDSLAKAELSNRVNSLELALGKATQKKILNDTLICPGDGVPIFNGKAQISYRVFNKESQSAEISLESVGGLKIENDYFYFSGPASQDTFTVDKIKYIFNFSGFDQSTKEGCIKISISKK